MSSILKSLALLADPTRVRLLHLLSKEELSVAELQEITTLGQSNISTQLAKLKEADWVTDRRSGKNRIYQLGPASHSGHAWNTPLLQLLQHAAEDLEETQHDLLSLSLVRRKRSDSARHYFDELAGKFGKHYLPGKSWQASGEMLLHLVPPIVIADLGAGEGVLSQMLAQRAQQVIAIDNSEKMVSYGAELAKHHGFDNLDYRLGEMEAPPIDPDSVDVVIFSQALHHATDPREALAAAHRILKPGGKVIVLDLLKHQFDKAKELYADRWLGFSEAQMLHWLTELGFDVLDLRVVDRERKSPHFQTLLAVAKKAE